LGTSNSATPQSKQTTRSGNTHTAGWSIFVRPGKWIPIFAVNFLWLVDPHDLQGILGERIGERASGGKRMTTFIIESDSFQEIYFEIYFADIRVE
jgi:hypothetical protein